MKKISIIMSLIVIMVNINITFADNSKVKTYKFDKDITMSGVISSTEKFFNVSDNWKVKDTKLNLSFTKSELLDIDYSTITVIVNGTPIHSEKLDGKKEYKKQIEVDIPSDIIKPGYNSLVIKSYKTISDMVCRDDSNTANWLVIHDESNINVNYDYNNIDNLVSEYDNIFTEIDEGENLNTTILIPDNYTNHEISSAMNLSADFGEKLKYDNFKLDVKYKSEFKDNNKNIIYIGSLDNTSSDILNLLTNEEKENIKSKALIKVSNSPFNKDKKILLIMSDNKELLDKASQLISSDTLIKNLNKEGIYIDENTDVVDLKNNSDSSKISLKDLGYNDILVKGPFSQEVTFDVSIPKNKLANLGSKLNLNIRYAKNLDFERSLVTAYINDVPIGSKKLSSEKADNDSLNINLPDDILNQNYYQIKVVFNLELLDLQCVTRDTDNPWAYILNNSYIDFDYSDNNNLSFNTYPYPFVKDGVINDVDIVIPNVISSNDLTNIANAVSYIGRDLKYNNGKITVLNDDEFLSGNKNKNTIIIGTPNNNNVIKDINSKLPLSFNEDFTGFKSNDKIKFVGDYESEIATIQLVKSLYTKDKSSLVIASTDFKDLSLATRYLSDLSLTPSLEGQVTTVDRSGFIQSLDFNDLDKEDNSKENISKKDQLSSDTKTFILISVILFIILVVSIVLLIFKYKK